MPSNTKNKEHAPGIPDRSHIAKLPDIKKPTDWQYSLQEHHADRAGLHYDLRLIDPETGHAHSWALPKAMLPAPGKPVLAVQQPTHTAEYSLSFGKDREEVIPSGYGKGRVKIKNLTTADVYHSKADDAGTRLRFNLYPSTGPEEYALVRTQKGQDLLVNKTLTRNRLPHLTFGEKPKVNEFPINNIDFKNQNEYMMPKYDGAHTLLDLKTEGKIPRLFSYRIPKRHSAGVIEHTHKVPTLLEQRVPKDLKGTVLRTETIAVDNKGNAIAAKDISGLLNATVTNSRARQKELGAHLVPVLLDVDKYRGKSVQHLPYSERLELLQDIGQRLNLPLPEIAKTNKEKRQLLSNIQKGKHPLTTEGVILRPQDHATKAYKAKIRPDHDVYVRRVFTARDNAGNAKDRAGGFEYSHTPTGPIVGRIGTGFSHTMARDMLNHPENYVGRVAKVEAETKHQSGALSKPSFKAWHLDKGLQKMSAYKEGQKAALRKLGMDSNAIKALLARMAGGSAVGGATGGVVDSENPMRGAAVGAIGGGITQGLYPHTGIKANALSALMGGAASGINQFNNNG